MADALHYVIAAGFGGAIGIGELVARYRDSPMRAVLTIPAMFYVAVNAVAAWAALLFISANQWDFGQASPAIPWWQTVVAGFTAMGVFRSSLFNVRVGDTDVAVGPAAFLSIMLSAADRAVDRARAEPRAASVAHIMNEVDFDRARVGLPVHCFALMQNLTPEEQQQFGHEINALAGADMGDDVKALNLGLALMNVVGESVLRTAVDSLGEKIRVEEVDEARKNELVVARAEAVVDIMGGVSFTRAQIALPLHCFALLQDVSVDDQSGVGQHLAALAGADIDEEVKVLNLGLTLMDVVGERVLRAAVNGLGEKIRHATA